MVRAVEAHIHVQDVGMARHIVQAKRATHRARSLCSPACNPRSYRLKMLVEQLPGNMFGQQLRRVLRTENLMICQPAGDSVLL